MSELMLPDRQRGNGAQYFAAKDGVDVAAFLDAKVGEWTNSIESNGLLDKLRNCFAMYHGAYYTDTGVAHQISFAGEQGELVNFPVNHFRNLATHMLNMTVANRPAVDCRATNTDYKSQVQTDLSNSILDYYFREKKLEVYLKKAVEYAIVYGSGFIIMGWDGTKGEVIEHDETTNTDIYEGDIRFDNLSPFDVMFDGTKESNVHDWILTRSWKNKYDLAAKYPEQAEKIKGLQTKTEIQRFRLGLSNLMDKTDDVQVLEFFHNRTDCMSDGRYMMFLSSDIVCEDTPLPYRSIPVFRVSAGDIHGTPHGYTSMFDIMPLQEAVNSLYSTVLTNQNAFGVQNVLVPRGSDIAVQQLAGGLNIIDYNQSAGAPAPLNLTNTPAEVFKFIQMIEQGMETLSGINSVARGQPEPSLKSGTALALVQSMALQFISGLQQSYVEMIESVGTSIIKMLQDFAKTPRMVAIAGKTNRSFMKEFTSEDISNISRVVCDVANPLSKTLAGRTQMAEQLLQYQQIDAQQYVNLIRTGNLNSLTESTVHEQLLIRAENEAILDGEFPQAIFSESHQEHIEGHRAILFDPELKKDANLVARVYNHIQQHITLLRTVDPDLLMVMKQQPLHPLPSDNGPQQNSGPGGPSPQPGQPLGPPPGPGESTSSMLPPEQGIVGLGVASGHVAGPGIEGGVRLPNIAKVNASLLPNPVLQQQSLNNVNKNR